MPVAGPAQAPAVAPATKPSGVVLRTLTEDEQKARVHALADARLREAEERRIAEEEAQIRAGCTTGGRAGGRRSAIGRTSMAGPRRGRLRRASDWHVSCTSLRR